MERHFDEQLAALKLRLMKMSALALSMIDEAIKALVEKNEAMLPLIRQKEEQVNQMQVEIDETCLTLIALHQPTAIDLRFILGAAKTNTDLERLADQAVNIGSKAERLMRVPPIKPFVIIPRMAAIAGGMVNDSLHAYVTRDVERARQVLLRDDELDDLKSRITEDLVQAMKEDPASISQAMDLILVSRNLERIGDHATNIAENAIFVAEGRDIRHHLGDKTAMRAV